MANIPATTSAWMAFAPDTVRERKMRSGMSGSRAVASRTRKAASSARARPPRRRVEPAPQPSLAAGSTIV